MGFPNPEMIQIKKMGKLLIKAKPFVKEATTDFSVSHKENGKNGKSARHDLIFKIPLVTGMLMAPHLQGCRCGARWGCRERQTQLSQMSRINTGTI